MEKYLCTANLYDASRKRCFTAGKYYEGKPAKEFTPEAIEFVDDRKHPHIVDSDWLQYFEKLENL